jgi:hypothetical protein
MIQKAISQCLKLINISIDKYVNDVILSYNFITLYENSGLNFVKV